MVRKERSRPSKQEDLWQSETSVELDAMSQLFDTPNDREGMQTQIDLASPVDISS